MFKKRLEKKKQREEEKRQRLNEHVDAFLFLLTRNTNAAIDYINQIQYMCGPEWALEVYTKATLKRKEQSDASSSQ
jgi:hypothetical protein